MRLLGFTFFAVYLSAHADFASAGCMEGLLLRARQFFTEMRGGELMQEGLPIERQLLAKDFPDDFGLARAWAFREPDDPNSMPNGFGMKILGDGLIEFIMSVPNWKAMTNQELRPLVSIFKMQSVLEFIESMFSFGESTSQTLKLMAEYKIKPADFKRWQETFPDRPLREEVLYVLPRL